MSAAAEALPAQRRGLKRFAPRGLLGRSLLLILGPLLIVQAVALTAFYGGHVDVISRRLATSLAGEIGMVQMLPRDILERGEDGDNDGAITLATSAPDAIVSAAHMLQFYGWRAGEPWMQEVSVPQTVDWSQSGLETERPSVAWQAMGVAPKVGQLAPLPASLILPQGRKGPAFLVYPNFKVLFEWNKSFTYVTTAAHFAARIEGAAPYDSGTPEIGLTTDQMIALQKKLATRGYKMGKADGVLGAATRAAVQAEQKRLGLPADGWPTPALLELL